MNFRTPAVEKKPVAFKRAFSLSEAREREAFPRLACFPRRCDCAPGCRILHLRMRLFAESSCRPQLLPMHLDIRRAVEYLAWAISTEFDYFIVSTSKPPTFFCIADAFRNFSGHLRDYVTNFGHRMANPDSRPDAVARSAF